MLPSFYDSMASMYVDFYNKHTPNETYDFVLKTKVALSVLNIFYEKWIPNEIVELGKLPEDQKQKYWDIGCRYFESMQDRIKASKAVYVLELITANV